MGIVNYPFGLASFGVPLTGGLMTQGNNYFVCPRTGSDANNGLSPSAPFATLGHALSTATANQNDVVYLFAQGNTAGDTTNYLSANLDWNKNAVHLIGINAMPQLGQRSRIAQLSTVKDIETLVTLSANGCIFANIEIFQGVASSTATAEVALSVTGQRNHIINCQISGNGDLAGSTDDAGSRSLLLSGSENLFEKCYIGLDTVIRTTQTAEIGFTGTPTRNIFKDCIISSYTSTTAFLLVTVAAGMDRFTIFDNCKFLCAANITSSAAPAGVFGGSLSTINGCIHLITPYTNCTQYAAADAARVLALGSNGLATDHLIGIAQAIDVT